MSALIKEFRLQIKSDIAETSSTVQEMENVISMVKKLQHQCHKPELMNVYILFVVIFLLLSGIYITLRATRDRIVNFLHKETIQNAHLGELLPKPLDPNLPLPLETTNALQKMKKKHLDNPLEPVPQPRNMNIL